MAFLLTYRIGSTTANAKDLDDTGTKTTVGHERGDGAALFHAATQVAGFSADAEEGTIISVLARSLVPIAATLQIYERILTGLAHCQRRRRPAAAPARGEGSGLVERTSPTDQGEEVQGCSDPHIDYL